MNQPETTVPLFGMTATIIKAIVNLFQYFE